MALPALNLEKRFTYADYQTWPDVERWELIDGYAYAMSPAPLVDHQRILREFSNAIGNHLKGKPCEMLFVPTDVRVPGSVEERDEDIDTVVQPDLLVICDPTKIDDKGVRGVPDFIVEILSPSTAKHDFNEKFLLYERIGVREYWIVDPANRCIHVYRLSGNGKFSEAVFVTGREAAVQSTVLEGLTIPLSDVFRFGGQ